MENQETPTTKPTPLCRVAIPHYHPNGQRDTKKPP